MLRGLQHNHIHAHLRGFKLTTTGSTATVDQQAADTISITRNAAGKSTIVPYRTLQRAGIVLSQVGVDIAAGGYGTYDTDPSTSAIVSEMLGAAGSGDEGTSYLLSVDYDNLMTDRITPAQSVTASIKSPRLMGFKISSAAAVSIGAAQASASKASSVYTVSFTNCFGKSCLAWATPIASAQKATRVDSTSSSAVAVATFDSSEVAEDNAFYLLVLGDDSLHEYWGMNRVVQVPQLKPRLEIFRISGSGTAAIALGSTDATLVDNGTGDYSLTWTKAFAREPIVICTAKAGRAQCLSAASATAVNVGSFGATGTAADDDINVFVLGYDGAEV